MPRQRPDLSEYRAMWLFALFDLPVDSPEARREYTRFRKALLKYGFVQMQYSVYARYVASEEAEKVHRRRIRAVLPPEGQIRLLSVTDRQYGKMELFYGKSGKPVEKPPAQLLLF